MQVFVEKEVLTGFKKFARLDLGVAVLEYIQFSSSRGGEEDLH